MDKKSLSLILLSTLLIAGYVPIAVAHNAPFSGGYDATSAIVDTIAEPETLDPAWCYDTASAAIIINVYETMIFFDNVMTDGPYAAGKVDQFKPLLATAWAWTPGPAPYVKTITFTIRSGVTFHDGSVLTAADAEYSWERWMVQDRDGGPQWMLYYPVLGTYAADDPVTDPNFGDKINNAITSTADTVSIHLMTDYDENRFLQIMSQPWAGVVEKAWAVGLGDFDGNWAAGWAAIYAQWHNPATSFIEGAMMGNGPYKLYYWVRGTACSVIKNDAYWDGWPARVRRAPATSNERNGGYLSRVTWNLLTSWTTRRARFLAGDADFTYVPRQFKGQVLGSIVGGEPIRCYYPFPMLALDAFFFNFDINPQSPYLGLGFDPASPYTIAEDRIPINLFSDWNVRRGFAAAFNYALYLSTVYPGEATQPTGPWPTGLGYDNPSATTQTFNLVSAASWLQSAFGGALWANGMSFTLLFNSGNVARETAVTILMSNINSMNPRFHLTTQEVAWGSEYLPRMVAQQLPLFSMGWQADYTDPDNFAFAFMHSKGTLAKCQSFSDPRSDSIIEAGVLFPEDTNPYNGELDGFPPMPYFNNYYTIPPGIPPDTRWPKRSIYYELQWWYYDYIPSVPIAQPVGRHWEQAWMRGWYYNPLYGGSLASAVDSTAPEAPVLYFYHLWKAVTHFGDANNDGAVNVVDGATVSASWTKPSPTSPLGPLGYKTQADVTGGTGGLSPSGSGLVGGIPDGKVNVVDAALVSAYWDGPPKGPSHP